MRRRLRRASARPARPRPNRPTIPGSETGVAPPELPPELPPDEELEDEVELDDEVEVEPPDEVEVEPPDEVEVEPPEEVELQPPVEEPPREERPDEVLLLDDEVDEQFFLQMPQLPPPQFHLPQVAAAGAATNAALATAARRILRFAIAMI